jgi:hypothetical protein
MKSDQKTKTNLLWCETPETAQKRVEQARSLKGQAEKGGLKMEIWLDSCSALWILNKIEEGVFMDPAEAVQVYVGQAREIDPYPEVKRQILNCFIQNGIESGVAEGVSAHEFMGELLKESEYDCADPAVWVKIQQNEPNDS